MLTRLRWVFTEGVGHDIQRIGTALDRLDGGSDVLRPSEFQDSLLEADRPGRRPNLTHLQYADGVAHIGHNGQPAEVGHDLAHEIESLAGKIGRLIRQASDVAAGMSQTRDDAGAKPGPPPSQRQSEWRMSPA